MEGKLVASAIVRLAERQSLEYEKVRLLQQGIGFFEETFDGRGFCLSEKYDLLSQWRGYAGNATGVAIGFSTEYLTWLSHENRTPNIPPCMLKMVEYEPARHEACVKPIYDKFNQLITEGSLDLPHHPGLLITGVMTDQQIETSRTDILRKELSTVTPVLAPLLRHLFFLKSHAFQEECEWRILTLLIRNGEDDCLHRVVDNRIIPYLKVELVELERSPIVEVILGPKHGTPPKIVENFLKLNGYGLVKVKHSEASYR